MSVPPVAAPSPDAQPLPIEPVGEGDIAHWTCDEFGVMARASTDRRQLVIDWNGGQRRLTRDRFNETRYTGDDTSFETNGNAARLALEGDEARSCVPATRASPWNAALLRGVAFRAVGNEPGWYVELGRGQVPRLYASLDYGERALVLERSQRIGDIVRGIASGGVVVLGIERRPCEDGMSGQRFDARATLRIGERIYTGCGAFLDD